MLPSRFVPGQSNMRKSRLEGKPSLLPKPRRPGSTDRMSTETRRPSATGPRSSSVEPPRATYGGARLSREASATKLPLSGRSRSQQGEKFGQSSMTPLRSSQYSRPTTTPVRTPSGDRANRSWQTSLERALAFVTIKDQRSLTNVAWQRSEFSRLQASLAARVGGGGGGGGGGGCGVGSGAGGGVGGMALIRPLTITRFVEIADALLTAITKQNAILNNDNYVTKLPNLAKRLLYPGTLSRSWLRTVNTLHSFPHALALIAYLLDLADHIETPVSDEWLYVRKDELERLRRDYLYKRWIRFQEPGAGFEDLNEEYLQNLKAHLGNDEEKIVELQQIIKKYEACLEDEVEAAARAEEARRGERRGALAGALRGVRGERRGARARGGELRAARTDTAAALRQLELDIERATAENLELKQELESQCMSISERTKLLDEVDYANRVLDSKRSLAEQISKMVLTKETELALWQKRSLDACVEYKQGLIHLAAQFPDLAALAVDEKELMSPECATLVSAAVESLRACGTRLGERRAEHARNKSALARKRAALLEEARTKISEMKLSIQREQEALDGELAKESSEAGASGARVRELRARAHALRARQDEHGKIDRDLDFWEKQDAAWRSQLQSMQDYIQTQREEAQRVLEKARTKRVQLVVDNIRVWNETLQ